MYVLNHCHFCHGVDLTQATMGAANLSQSPLVGADDDGNMIGPLVKAGLPNLQTAMPSYTELTSEEIVDLARYVHFLRQQARFKELSRLADTPAGDRTTGEAYFNGAGNCRSCHSVSGDLSGVGRKYDTATLRARLLRPGPTMPSEGVSPTAGQSAHLKLLENYTRGQRAGSRRISRRDSVVQVRPTCPSSSASGSRFRGSRGALRVVWRPPGHAEDDARRPTPMRSRSAMNRASSRTGSNSTAAVTRINEPSRSSKARFSQ